MMKISPMPLGTWIPPWNNQNGGFLSPIIPTIEVKSSVYLHANLCCHAPCFTHIHHSKLQSFYPKFNFHLWSMCAVSARLQCLLNQLHLDSDSKSQKSFDGDYLSSLWKIIYIWPHQPLFPIWKECLSSGHILLDLYKKRFHQVLNTLYKYNW